MYCINCNSEIFDDEKSCDECGNFLPRRTSRVKLHKNKRFLLSFAFTALVMAVLGAIFFAGQLFFGQNGTNQFAWIQAKDMPFPPYRYSSETADELIFAYESQAVIEGAVAYTFNYDEYELLSDETDLVAVPEFHDFYEAVNEELGSLSGKVIVLDAGHGDDSGGMFLGYREGVRMLFLARLLRDELESRGATVLMIRDCGFDIHIADRVAMMNRWSLEAIMYDRQNDAEYFSYELSELSYLIEMLDRIISDRGTYARVYMNFPFDRNFTTRIHPSWQRMFEFQSDPLITYNWLAISLHSNASSPFDEGINGAFVFYASNSNLVSRPYFADYSHEYISRLFGDLLLDGIAQIGIRRNRLTSSSYMFIRETNLPAVLVENGFHTNPANRALLASDSFMQNLAIVYADTIEEYFLRIRYGELQ